MAAQAAAAGPATAAASNQFDIDEIDELSPQQLQQVSNTYQQLRSELQSFQQKQAELEVERTEHRYCASGI